MVGFLRLGGGEGTLQDGISQTKYNNNGDGID